jgi:TRAP-type C4-dicarboxylate transport system permease small subunit
LVLSYAYWHDHFHDDAGVVGRTVQINKHQFTIIGVAPPAFRGTELFFAPAMWIPIVEQPIVEDYNGIQYRGNHGAFVDGRLKPGMTPAQATEDLNTVGAWLSKTYPSDDEGVKFSLARPGLVGDMLGRPARAFVAGLMLLAGLILLAACANLGSLFAARTADRAKETALRLALGSRRGAILRQMLTEAVLVSLAGGALGLGGGVVMMRLLSAWQPIPDVPINVPVNPDASTYVVALLLALASGLLFGIVPVRQVINARRPVASDSHRCGKRGRVAAIDAARCSAGGADRDLRGAGDLFAGSGARASAIVAQQLRLCPAERHAAGVRPAYGGLRRREVGRDAATHAGCDQGHSRRNIGWLC